MKLARIGTPGNEIPIAVQADRTYDLRSITNDIDPVFFEAGGFDLVEAAVRDGRLPQLATIETSVTRYGPPIAWPRAVICIGMNYAAHAAESGSEPPTDLVIFYKHPNTLVGPNDTVRIPQGSVRTDWEVELAIVIGKRARYIDTPAQAIEHIAGYTISNDVSERDFQLKVSGGQWSKGKSAETFNPLGPWIVSASEIDIDRGLRIESRVNGETRQSSSTSDLIFSTASIVQQLSQYMVLEPGDVINTGTPEGVALSGRFPYLREGDIVECTIEGLGTQRQVVA